MHISITLIISDRLCDLLCPFKRTGQKTLFSNYEEKSQDLKACLILQDKTGNSEEAVFSSAASVGAGYLFADQVYNKYLLTSQFCLKESPQMDLLGHFH